MHKHAVIAEVIDAFRLVRRPPTHVSSISTTPRSFSRSGATIARRGLATAWLAPVVGWAVGAIAFVVVLAALLTYWNRSIAHLQASIRPMFPTPPDAHDEPI